MVSRKMIFRNDKECQSSSTPSASTLIRV